MQRIHYLTGHNTHTHTCVRRQLRCIVSAANKNDALQYLPGFNNIHTSEAEEGALPQWQNSPQKSPFGLYAEQLSGTAFTVPRKANQWTWTYRLRPSVAHFGKTRLIPAATTHEITNTHTLFASPPTHTNTPTPPLAYRWSPLPPLESQKQIDFVNGIVSMAARGSPASLDGGNCLLYVCNTSMNHPEDSQPEKFFQNNDADMLFIPQTGALQIKTELGCMRLAPFEIGVVRRGIRFQVNLETKKEEARGYLCENYGAPFTIPDLGPIGASSGLANPRHFLSPLAAYEDKKGEFKLVTKFQGNLWESDIHHSPFDIVAWYGNYLPYKYDLRLFTCINSVTFDHPDPSIYTVLTSPTTVPGQANIDFAIFPPRWVSMENTFRPPWYHRNFMSEFMGIIEGSYDAKPSAEFSPGAFSLHNCMVPHGPDSNALKHATDVIDTSKPERYDSTLAFMWESCGVWLASEFALKSKMLQEDYTLCWKNIPSASITPKGSAQKQALPFDWKVNEK